MKIVNYQPTENISFLKEFIETNSDFYLFGADTEGEFCLNWLKERGKNVKGFFDNDLSKIGKSIMSCPIININNIDLNKIKIIITSIHSDEIAKQLEKSGLKLFKNYIAYDNLYWIDENHFSNCVGKPFFNFFINNETKFKMVYNLLADEYSKDIYTRVINYRLTSLNPIKRGKENLPIPFMIHKEKGKKKDELETILNNQLENNLQDDVKKLLISNLLKKTYEYKNIITNDDLNIVIDAGGFIGDTAAVFAYKNKTGKVFSFEPSKIGFQKITNIKNSFPNIEPIRKGLWSENAVLKYNESNDNLESSRIGEGKSEIEVVSLDYFVEKNKISKIDLIKMDIEGSELHALSGAKNVIAKYKPDLAICIYHSPSDLCEIPLWIKTNFPEYNIYIDHTDGMFVWGTVCFATIR